MTTFKHDGKTWEVVSFNEPPERGDDYFYVREVKVLPTTPGSVIAVDGRSWRYFLTDSGWINEVGDKVPGPTGLDVVVIYDAGA